MTRLLQDLLYALRLLRRNPGFTTIAVLALALGIGAITAVYSVVDAVLLKPLPYKDSDRVVILWERAPKMDLSVAYPDFEDWRARNTVFESMAAFRRDSLNLIGTGEPERLQVRYVSWQFFRAFGADIPVGRDFAASDDQTGAAPTIILTDSLWKRRFGADPHVVGRQISLSDKSFTVVGVAPASFRYGLDVDLFAPISLNKTIQWTRGNHPGIYVVGRLKPGVTVEQARSHMDTIAKAINLQDTENGPRDVLTRVQPVLQTLVEGVERPMWTTFVAVVFMLLITCSNVANLSLARATARHRELAIRNAVGASRWRIVQQLLVESVVLSLIGGALALLIAYWGVQFLHGLKPSSLPRLDEVAIDHRVLLFTLAISVLTGMLFGLYPALQGARTNINDLLKETAARGVVSAHRRFGNALIVAEFAIALVLLVGAGLTLKSMSRLLRVDPGFDANHLLTFQVSVPRNRADASVLPMLDRIKESVASVPGVESASYSSGMPLDFASETSIFRGDEPMKPEAERMTVQYIVSPEYFKVMGMRLIKGRFISPTDRGDAPPVVVIDENLAHEVFGDENPIGKTLKYGDPKAPILQVVGVVNHVKHYGLDTAGPVRDQMYVSMGLVPVQYLPNVAARIAFEVRAKGDAPALTTAIRKQVLDAAPEQPIFDISTYQSIVNRATETQRFTTTLLSAFAFIALMLAAVGIYGVIGYTVTQRTHEIGLRIALGARHADVLRLVLRQGLIVIALGTVIGWIASLVLTRFMKTILFEVKVTDPWVFAAISLVMVAAAILATLVPALRAARVDPMEALRYE